MRPIVAALCLAVCVSATPSPKPPTGFNQFASTAARPEGQDAPAARTPPSYQDVIGSIDLTHANSAEGVTPAANPEEARWQEYFDSMYPVDKSASPPPASGQSSPQRHRAPDHLVIQAAWEKGTQIMGAYSKAAHKKGMMYNADAPDVDGNPLHHDTIPQTHLFRESITLAGALDRCSLLAAAGYVQKDGSATTSYHAFVVAKVANGYTCTLLAPAKISPASMSMAIPQVLDTYLYTDTRYPLTIITDEESSLPSALALTPPNSPPPRNNMQQRPLSAIARQFTQNATTAAAAAAISAPAPSSPSVAAAASTATTALPKQKGTKHRLNDEEDETRDTEEEEEEPRRKKPKHRAQSPASVHELDDDSVHLARYPDPPPPALDLPEAPRVVQVSQQGSRYYSLFPSSYQSGRAGSVNAEPEDRRLPNYNREDAAEPEDRRLPNYNRGDGEEPEDRRLPNYSRPNGEEPEDRRLPNYNRPNDQQPEDRRLPNYNRPEDEAEDGRMPDNSQEPEDRRLPNYNRPDGQAQDERMPDVNQEQEPEDRRLPNYNQAGRVPNYRPVSAYQYLNETVGYRYNGYHPAHFYLPSEEHHFQAAYTPFHYAMQQCADFAASRAIPAQLYQLVFRLDAIVCTTYEAPVGFRPAFNIPDYHVGRSYLYTAV